MAWELRRGHFYYYKKVRDGDKVTSVYYGKNPDELDVLSAYCKNLQKLMKIKEQCWKAECRENLQYYQAIIKKEVIKKDPELLTRAKKTIFILKVYINPTQYLDKLYFLLLPRNVTEVEKKLLSKMAKVKIA